MKKKILFLHPNFPGQFKHICASFSTSHEVYFLCQTHYGRKINNVKLFTLKGKGSIDALEGRGNQLERAQIRGEQYRQGLTRLKERDWNPDVIICHSGWGCGTYSRELWGNAFIISYIEWWFNPTSITYTWDDKNIYLNLSRNNIKNMWARNQIQALEIMGSDELIAPTKWQRNQLPNILKEKCQIVFDGVDTSRLQPTKREKNKKFILTYGTRGMEPMRGFQQFIEALPEIVNSCKNIIIEIAGEDTINYGGTFPRGFTSWKDWAIDFLINEKISDKVHWKGFLEFDQYKEFLNKSDCHIYFTHPFVASWSLVEAICMGCRVIASDNKCTEEFEKYSTYKDQLIFVDHRQKDEVVNSVKGVYSAQDVRCKGILERNPQPLTNLSIASSTKEWARVAGLELPTTG